MRIVCAGTFDMLHTGHVSYLKAAKGLAPDSELFVIVARDKISAKIKGKKTINTEDFRLRKIKVLDFVDKAVLGFQDDLLGRIVSLKPDIIALGYDQWAGEDWLKQELEKRGLDVKIIRMQRFKKKAL